MQTFIFTLVILALGTLLAAARFRGHSGFYGYVDTSFATGATEAVKRWAARIWLELPREIYFSKFMKENDMNALIEVKRELDANPGDKVTFSFGQKLAGAGVTGDSTLEGNEEALTVYSDSVTVDQKRNAVRLGGKMSESRTAFNQRDLAKTMLRTWLAETIDNDVFTGYATSASTVLYGGSAVSTATVDATSKFTPGLIDKAVAKAKKAAPKIWPVKVGGKDCYVMLIHTDVAYDLRRDPEYNQAVREAAERGMQNNPIYTGALGYWNGCIVHEHEKIPVVTNWGAGTNQPGAQNFFMGRQSGVFAWGAKPEWWEKEFDYGNKVGFASGAIYAFKKAVFNAIDRAYIEVRTYRTNN